MPSPVRMSAQEFYNLYLQQDQSLTIVDLRTPEEVAESGLRNTIKLPVQSLTYESFISALNQNKVKNSEVYLLCKSGKRAYTATDILSDYDEKKLIIIEGGLMAIESLQVN